MKVKIISATLALTMIGSAILVNAATISRLGGSNRFETAKLINNKMNSKTLILASAFSFADALSATPLIHYYNGEIHLASTKLDQNTIDSLKKGEFKDVIIIGGTGVINTDIEAELVKYVGAKNVERLGGANRYQTSMKIVDKINKLTPTVPYTFIVSGADFADALSVAPIAAMTGSPVVLTDGKTLLPSAVTVSKKTSDTVYKIGGPTIVGNGFDKTIPSYERIYGANRYETNQLVVSEFRKLFTGDDVFVASGLDYPDSLAGSALAAREKAPIVFVGGNNYQNAKNSVSTLKKDNITALGGIAVVSPLVMDKLSVYSEDEYSNAVNAEILRLVNIERKKVGVSPLRLSTIGAHYATEKSEDMIINNYFDHDDLRGKTTFDYMIQDGIKMYAWEENIAKSNIKSTVEATAKDLVNMWMNSQEYKKNILNPLFTELANGIAYNNSQIYATQIFLKR